jgi:hypothetical protein
MPRAHSATLFPTEEPLSREQMIGREADVQELAAQLTGGVHRILAAPRRTGKSSVCRAAIAELRERGLYTVSVSLFSLTDGPALAQGLVAETLSNRDALHKLIQRARSTAGLRALALAGIASRRGRGGWYVSDPLLARYIRQGRG